MRGWPMVPSRMGHSVPGTISSYKAVGVAVSLNLNPGSFKWHSNPRPEQTVTDGVHFVLHWDRNSPCVLKAIIPHR